MSMMMCSLVEVGANGVGDPVPSEVLSPGWRGITCSGLYLLPVAYFLGAIVLCSICYFVIFVSLSYATIFLFSAMFMYFLLLQSSYLLFLFFMAANVGGPGLYPALM